MDATGCFGASCKTMKTQSIDNAKKCSVKPAVKDDYDACKSYLRIFPLLAVQILTIRRDSRASRCWRYG